MGVRHVVVVCESSDAGQTALRDAATTAQEWDARLTVLALAATERPSRCCNLQTTSWNAEMRRVAAEELGRARTLLQGADAAFVVREGCGRHAAERAATELGGDLLVRAGRRRSRRRTLTAR
jgi:hypothetical protein